MGIKETVKALSVIGLGEVYVTEEVKVKGGKKFHPNKRQALRALFDSYKSCTKCDLHKSRRQVVFGDGNPDSPVVFVGEAPGEEEDIQGKPFVGRAGRYLNDQLKKIGMPRETVYITNVNKCRPPGNRKPNYIEMQACLPYLRKELSIINPKIICCLGATAAEGILGKKIQITKMRGQLFPYPYNPSIKVFLTFHPAFILRNMNAENEFIEDLTKLREIVKGGL